MWSRALVRLRPVVDDFFCKGDVDGRQGAADAHVGAFVIRVDEVSEQLVEDVGVDDGDCLEAGMNLGVPTGIDVRTSRA